MSNLCFMRAWRFLYLTLINETNHISNVCFCTDPLASNFLHLPVLCLDDPHSPDSMVEFLIIYNFQLVLHLVVRALVLMLVDNGLVIMVARWDCDELEQMCCKENELLIRVFSFMWRHLYWKFMQMTALLWSEGDYTCMEDRNIKIMCLIGWLLWTYMPHMKFFWILPQLCLWFAVCNSNFELSHSTNSAYYL